MGVLQDNLVLSTELTMWIGHRKEIRKLTFRALALRRSESFASVLSAELIIWIGHREETPSSERILRSDEGLALEMSAFKSLYCGQFTLSTQLIKPNSFVIWFLTHSRVKSDSSDVETNFMTKWWNNLSNMLLVKYCNLQINYLPPVTTDKSCAIFCSTSSNTCICCYCIFMLR